ncbi:MAG: hypothetical protein KDA35_00095 [Hyphomonadaceae bacterium]|nr:hypothetical protein [Hyphomonadaceae bacterium]
MRTHSLFAGAALAIAACGQSASPPAETATRPMSGEYVLSCADFANLAPTAIVQRFGAENVTTEMLPGPEGETYEATLVYAHDPARRLEITWNEGRTAIASVMVSNAGTRWRGAEAYSVGTPIGDIERLNVMPFKLWGFGWDYGGWVSDWNLGTLSQTPGCNTRMRFEPRNGANTSAQGDSEFNSNSAEMIDADPAVAAFGLMFGDSGSE